MIQIKALSKSFGGRSVLSDVSFDVAAGKIVFIIGKSGTGKSVLLKSIVGLLTPDRGEIWVDGEEVSHFDESDYLKVRRKCGLVFQSPALLDSLTVAENIAFGLRAHRIFDDEKKIIARVAQVLGAVGLSSAWLTHYPGELSFGMQKRVSLARTLAVSPTYLLYDEPTTGLDPVAMRSVNALIARLARDLCVTSLVVSHDMDCALEIADEIVLLDEGRVAVIGTPKDLLASEHPVARAFLSEARG